MKRMKQTLSLMLAAILLVTAVGMQNIVAFAQESNPASAAYSQNDAQKRQIISFDNDWRYYKGDVVQGEKLTLDDSSWLYVNLPHSTTHYTPDNKEAYLGISWYRKTFAVDSALEGQKLLLTFEAAMQSADVWINGTKVLRHEGGYTPFVMDISDLVSYDQPNQIAVKIDSRHNPSFAPGKNRPDFQYFGGIYGKAYITVTDKLHITDAVEADVEAGGGVFITAPAVSKENASLNVKTHVANEDLTDQTVTLVTEVIDDTGAVVQSTQSGEQVIAAGTAQTLTQDMIVENPRLWSPNTPELYTVRSIVKVGDTVIDSLDTTYGIRKVEWKRSGLYLNDEKIDMQGANLHSEIYMLGNAVPDSAIFEEVRRFKENGFDALRMSHYPHVPAFYEACDKYGVLVIDCPSGWQNFSNTEAFKNSTYRELRTMIRTHRNYASIVVWEASLNESYYNRGWAQEVNRIVDVEYPESGVSKAYTAGCYHWDTYDIGLSTPQAGIFGAGNEGALGTVGKNKPIIIAEYGDWSYGGTNSTTRVTREPVNTYGKKGGDEGMLIQADNVQESVAVNRQKGADWLGLDAYWDYADYAGFDAGTLTYCGVVDVTRLPKHSAYFYRSQRPADVDLSKYGIESGPMVYIANTWAPGSPSDVRIYSNCDEVELFLNGKSLGTQGPDATIYGPHGDGNQGNYPVAGAGKQIDASSLAHPPITFKLGEFTPGELVAVGKINGEKKAETIRRTPGTAAQINLRPENDVPLKLDGSDARLVWIDVMDDTGTVVNTATNGVSFAVEGPGLVIGEKTVAVRGGQLAVWVRSKRGEGDITLTATADGLTSKTITLPTQAVAGLPAVPEGGDADETEHTQDPVIPDNIFLNKTATASSENPSGKTGPELASKANDGDNETKWCASSGTYPQWWQADLKSSIFIEDITLVFETDATGIYKYTISVSDTPDNWTAEKVVIDQSANTSSTQRTFDINQKGRYVRVELKQAYNVEWAVLREVSGHGKDPNANIALNKTTTASSENKNSELAKFANDGDLSTKWCASAGVGTSGHWWQVNLGAPYQLSDVQIQFEMTNAAYKFVLQGSTDGINYKTIKDFRDTEGCGQTVDVETDAIVQYLRIYDITTKNMATQWPCIVEVSARGSKTDYTLVSVSREKAAIASSSAEGSTPALGSSGVPGQFWYPATSGDEWWVIDTGGYYNIDNVQMTWNENEAHRYTVDVSTDGKTWTTEMDKSENTVAEGRAYNGVSAFARFIRVSMPGVRETQQGFGLLDAYAPAPIAKKVTDVPAIDAITGAQGSAFTALNLPKEAAVTLEGDISALVPVSWSQTGYNPDSLEPQTLTGTLKVIPGVTLPEETAVSIQVTLETAVPSVSFADIGVIDGAVGTEFKLPVSINVLSKDAKAIEGVMTLPDGIAAEEIAVNKAAISADNFDWNVSGSTLRFAFLNTDKDSGAIDFTGNQDLLNITFVLTEGKVDGTEIQFNMDRLSSSNGTDSVVYNLDKAVSKAVVEIPVVVGMTARNLFTGDGVDVIPANKQAIAVEFTGMEKASCILLDTQPLYYSPELTAKSGKSGSFTYVVYADSTVVADELTVEDFTITTGDIPEILFGITSDSSKISAQDALNTVSVWLRKMTPTEKQILAMNVTADSRIDTSDAISIVDNFLSGKEFEIVRK